MMASWQGLPFGGLKANLYYVNYEKSFYIAIPLAPFTTGLPFTSVPFTPGIYIIFLPING